LCQFSSGFLLDVHAVLKVQSACHSGARKKASVHRAGGHTEIGRATARLSIRWVVPAAHTNEHH
jgi:hypothetical protein